MNEPLRPMSTGQLLDRTFALYRKNFLLFVGIATVGPAAYLLFELFMVGSGTVPGAGASPGRVAAFGATYVIGMFLGLLVMLAGMTLSHAATVRAVAAVHLGRQITIGGAYSALRGRVGRVLGVFVLVALLAGGSAFVIVMIAVMIGTVAVVGGAQGGTAGTVVGALVGIGAAIVGGVLAIAIWVRYSLAIQACVVEDLRPVASLKRSAVLSKGARGRILAIYFLFGVLSYMLGLAMGALAGGAGTLIPSVITRMILVYVAGFIAGSLTGPLATIGVSLLYYDERVRKEAFDLQLMMASLDAPVPPVAAPAQI